MRKVREVQLREGRGEKCAEERAMQLGWHPGVKQRQAGGELARNCKTMRRGLDRVYV